MTDFEHSYYTKCCSRDVRVPYSRSQWETVGCPGFGIRTKTTYNLHRTELRPPRYKIYSIGIFDNFALVIYNKERRRTDNVVTIKLIPYLPCRLQYECSCTNLH